LPLGLLHLRAAFFEAHLLNQLKIWHLWVLKSYKVFMEPPYTIVTPYHRGHNLPIVPTGTDLLYQLPADKAKNHRKCITTPPAAQMYSQSHSRWRFRKLRAQSSNVSFATLQWKETFELWALSFERAFKNITACEIACIYRHVCICVCACVYAYVQVCMIHACMCAYMYFTRGVQVCNCVLTRLPWSQEVALDKREHRISIYIYVCTCAGIYAGMYIYINVYEILYTLIRYTIHPQLSTYICWAWTHRSWSNRIDNVTVCRALTCTTASTTASSHTAQRTEWKKKTYSSLPSHTFASEGRAIQLGA